LSVLLFLPISRLEIVQFVGGEFKKPEALELINVLTVR
jgi:hypothetical protein